MSLFSLVQVILLSRFNLLFYKVKINFDFRLDHIARESSLARKTKSALMTAYALAIVALPAPRKTFLSFARHYVSNSSVLI